MGSDDTAIQRFAGRSGAVFLTVVGLLTILDTILRGDLALQDVNAVGAIAAGGGTALAGVVMLFLPWDRWSPRAPMVLPVLVAIIAIPVDRAVHFSTDPSADASYGTLAFCLLAWIGLSQPRWTAARFAPLLAAVLAVNAATTPGSVVDVSVPLVVVPMATVLAEICSWVVAELTRTRQADGRRARSLEAVAAPLATSGGLGELEASIEHAAVRIFAASGATLVPGDLVPPGDGAALAIALRGPEGLLGTVVVSDPAEPDHPFTTNLARLFGQQAGSALARQHLIDALSSDAQRDPLTGVGNRRHALKLLEDLRPGDAVLLIDVDDFKGVNDTHGHQAGDEVLCRLARYLVSIVGDPAVSRLGGDEFLVVEATGGRTAGVLAEQVVHDWRADITGTTLSVGVALHDGHPQARPALKRADQALYRAKDQGRDRVVVDDEVASAV